MPLIVTTFHDCDCVPSLDCQILRSKYKIPKQIVGRSNQSVYVTFFDGTQIGLTSIAAFSKNKYSRTFSLNTDDNTKISAFYYDGYIWVVGTLSLKGIIVHGLFENPDEVEDFPLCDVNGVESATDTCYDGDADDFPIDAELVYPMYQEVIRLLGMANQQFAEDNENNARLSQVTRDQE